MTTKSTMSAIEADVGRRLGGASVVFATLAVLLGLGAAVAGAAFSAPVNLSVAGQNAVNSQVASDADGDAVAVWQGYDGSNYRVQARSLSAAGVLGPIKTLSAAGQFADYPQVASDADGDAVAVWHNDSNSRVQARSLSAAGVLGPAENLSAAGQEAYFPQIASDADGDAVAVWQRSDGSSDRVQARTISAAGVLEPIKNLSPAGQDAVGAQVASDADGDAVAVWQNDSNSRVQARSISAAGVLGPIENVSAAGQDASEPQVASDADGDAVAVWKRAVGEDYSVQARTISAAGVLGSIENLSAAGQTAVGAQVASDADGDAVAVWHRYDGSRYRVQARTISAAGVLGPTRTLSAAGENAFLPQVASDADGDAVAVWYRFDGSKDRVQARTIPAAGVLGPIKNLSAAGQNANGPQVASDADGDAVAVWYRLDGTNNRVQASRGP